jgi:hypothetical protein
MSEDIKEIINDLQRVADRKCYPEDILDGSIAQEWADYITNLQEENERLKKENKHIFANVNDDELLISNAMNYAELQDYKSRTEKALEYIHIIDNRNSYIDISELRHIEKLLNGGDE